MAIIRFIGLIWLLLISGMASAQQLPALSGRIVDNADMLSPEQENGLAAKLQGLEQATTRQLVVVTVPDLQGYPVEDFAYRLGNEWKLGNKEADNGAILLIARAERRIRIEVGDGLEPILPDAMAWIIIRDRITPRFKANDYAGGITAGVDALIEQLQAPPEQAEARAREAAQQQAASRNGSNDGGSIFPLIFWGVIIVFFILPMFRRRGKGRRYRRGGSPVVIWGPGWGSGGGWGGGSGGFGGGFGGGGFSGGGGSFGGGGASGGW